MNQLTNRRAVITGAGSGIGAAIARAYAVEGARLLLADRHAASLAETAITCRNLGAEVVECVADVGTVEGAQASVDRCVEHFGGIDILVNNASAIWLRGTLDTPMKRFDLMQQVNSRGSFLCAQACLPHLLQAPNPHILTLAPPPSLDPKWWAPHTGYTLAKMGMSFVTLGLAAEFAERGIAINALWPRTVIATDAINMIPGVDPRNCRTPQIVADAAHVLLLRDARGINGRFLIDEDVLREAGTTDFAQYAVEPGQPLLPDLFLE